MIEKPPEGHLANPLQGFVGPTPVPEKCLSPGGGIVLRERNRGGREADCQSGHQPQQTHLDACCPPEGKALASSWLTNTIRGKTKIKGVIMQRIRKHNKNKSHCSQEKEKTYGGLTLSCSVQRWMLFQIFYELLNILGKHC